MTEPANVALVQSIANRSDLLRALRDGPVERRPLGDALGVSRSTVDRAVRNLSDHGLVAQTDAGLRLTLRGRLSLDAYDAFVETAAGLSRARPLLAPLSDSVTLEPPLFRDARLVDAHEDDPVGTLRSAMERADRVWLVTPIVLDDFVDACRSAVVDGGLDLDLVCTSTALDSLVTDHRDAVLSAMDTGRLRLHRTGRDFECGLFVVDADDDTAAYAIVFDGDDGVRAVVASDDEQAGAWARHRATSLVEGATPLSPE
ncbi:helix-turn-helix transcriptional regulator [Halobacteriaceae archaeon GCM10025711]